MSEIIIMPKLGFNMDEGQLVKWHKKVGDPVAKGDLLFEINTDKTTMPVEAVNDGFVLKLMLEEGEYAPVFTPICVVGAVGENADAILANAGNAKLSEGVAPSAASAAPQEIAQQGSMAVADVKLTPRAKTYIIENGLDLATVSKINGTGFDGGITEKDIKASPLAKKVAEGLGVDLGSIGAGSGANGKILKEDVQNAAKVLPAAVSGDMKILKKTPYKGIRKIIGDRLSESKFTAPHLYFTQSVDITNLNEFRAKLNENSEVKITFTDLLVMASAKALAKYPDINSSLKDGNIISYKSANIGVAVAGDNGLVVPVVRDVQEKSLTDVAVITKDLVSRGRVGKLASEEYQGGTFTVSNLGMFGIEFFTAIINLPEAAILAVSAPIKTAVVIESEAGDTIAIRPVMKITLSVDHRIIDGLIAAQFVGCMKDLLENPIKILM